MTLEEIEAKRRRGRVFRLVCNERLRQDAKFGVQSHEPALWSAVLGEEVGEVCQAVVEAHFNGHTLDSYREELVHVAAVAFAALEHLERLEEDAA